MVARTEPFERISLPLAPSTSSAMTISPPNGWSGWHGVGHLDSGCTGTRKTHCFAPSVAQSRAAKTSLLAFQPAVVAPNSPRGWR